MYTCPHCGKVFVKDFGNEKEFIEHLTEYSHRDFTDRLIDLFDNIDDFGYLISCLKNKLDNKKTEEWYNS